MKEFSLQSSNSVKKKNDEIKFMNKVEHHKKIQSIYMKCLINIDMFDIKKYSYLGKIITITL